jgi:hypothetical protein
MLALLLFVLGVTAQTPSSTGCQVTSYYGQLVGCPQQKDLQNFYTSAEISSICSVCNLNSTTLLESNNIMFCCPSGVPTPNGSRCQCTSGPFCATCGYSPQQQSLYCQPWTNISRFATFGLKVWACPYPFEAPMSNVLGWECSCGPSGIPCFYCYPPSIGYMTSFSVLLVGIMTLYSIDM